MTTTTILTLAGLFLFEVTRGATDVACGEQPGASATPASERARCATMPGKGVLATVNDRGEILTSNDGIASVARSSRTRLFLRDIVCGNGQFVAVGGSYLDVPGVIMTSTDRLTWTRRIVRNKINLHGVTHGGGQFVAVGDAGTILTSTDGVAWKSRVSGTPADLAAVSFGNGIFVAGGESGVVLTSINAVHWIARSLGPSLYVGRIIFQDGHFLVPQSGTTLDSDDGQEWHHALPVAAINR